VKENHIFLESFLLSFGFGILALVKVLSALWIREGLIDYLIGGAWICISLYMILIIKTALINTRMLQGTNLRPFCIFLVAINALGVGCAVYFFSAAFLTVLLGLIKFRTFIDSSFLSLILSTMCLAFFLYMKYWSYFFVEVVHKYDLKDIREFRYLVRLALRRLE